MLKEILRSRGRGDVMADLKPNDEMPISAAARIKGVSRATIHRAIREGRLPARWEANQNFAAGGTWRVRWEDLSAWRPADQKTKGERGGRPRKPTVLDALGLLPEPWTVTREEWRRLTKIGRFQLVGPHVRGEAAEHSDVDLVAMLTPVESEAFLAPERRVLPDDILETWEQVRRACRGRARKADVFVVTHLENGRTGMYCLYGTAKAWKVNPVDGAAAAIAGGWPKGVRYPRALHSAVCATDGVWRVARSEAAGDQPGRFVERCSNMEDAVRRAEEMDAAEAGPPAMGQPDYTTESAADYGHLIAVLRAVYEGKPVRLDVRYFYKDYVEEVVGELRPSVL